MKKFATLLLAGVMSLGAIPLTACFIHWQEEPEKIPQIPQGVVLQNVALEDMESTANKFNAGLFVSKNLKAESYRDFKFYIEENGETRYLEEYETSLSVKYLEENGKTYAESKRLVKNHDKHKYHIDIGTNMEQYRDDEKLVEGSETYFYKDNYLGMIYDSYKNVGHEIVKLPGYVPPVDEASEWNEVQDKHLQYLYTNAGDFFSQIKGINILKQAPFGSPYNLPDIPLEYISSRGGCGVNLHKKYIETEDPFTLVEPGVNISSDYYLETYKFVLANYSFTMQADDTKVYVKQIYTVYFVRKDNNLLDGTLECAFGYYQDNDSNLTANDFKDYLTDDALTDTYYYDCDKEQVKADFMAGKEVVISPVGGYDIS